MAHAAINDPAAREPGNNAEPPREATPLETAEVPRAGVLARLCHYIPTVLVTAFLAGLWAFGHHSGWKVPKFSALAGNGAAERKDWCEEHGVPESQCVECHPDLLPKAESYDQVLRARLDGVHEFAK